VLPVGTELSVFNSISPYVRRAWDGNMLPGWQLKERILFDYEIVYIMEGAAVITIEDRIYNAQPGELYIISPGVRHSMRTVDQLTLRQPHIHFDLFYTNDSEEVKVCYRLVNKLKEEELQYIRKDNVQASGFHFPERLIVRDRDTVEKLMFSLIKEHESPDDFTFLRSKAIFLQLLVHILVENREEKQQSAQSSRLNFENMNVVKEYIKLNYRTKITIEKLAQLSGLSKSHLNKKFKAVFQTSPLKYQMSVKVNKATRLITYSHNNLSEIAVYLGFLDIQHFSKVFKKHMGMNPSEYKRTYS
jgi:AraC-like DNA-binding protein